VENTILAKLLQNTELALLRKYVLLDYTSSQTYFSLILGFCFIFNNFSLIQSLTTAPRRHRNTIFAASCSFFSKAKQICQKTTNAKLESLSWFSCDGSHLNFIFQPKTCKLKIEAHDKRTVIPAQWDTPVSVTITISSTLKPPVWTTTNTSITLNENVNKDTKLRDLSAIDAGRYVVISVIGQPDFVYNEGSTTKAPFRVLDKTGYTELRTVEHMNYEVTIDYKVAVRAFKVGVKIV
jgi:hypothetical protein